MTTAREVSTELKSLANSSHARNLEWFFKTGPGEYGEGDRFLGIKVPEIRAVARKFRSLPEAEISSLAQSDYHEERFAALAILTDRFKKSKSSVERTELFRLYLDLLDRGLVNNWDLVDSTAPYMGKVLVGTDPIGFLKQLADSENLWKQRTAVMFTFAFVVEHELEPTFEIVQYLMGHDHDLIHKASGWMLREAGKRDLSKLRAFLEDHAATMPRTMLRYAIEKLSKEERAHWLSRKSQQ